MFTGSIVALVAPLTDDDQVDHATFAQLVNWQIEQGSSGIVVNGTTGEAPTLTMEEQAALIKTAIDTARGRVPVIAGTGAYSTTTTIKFTQQAIKLGVDGCLIVTPYYNKPHQRGLYAHFRSIAAVCNTPIIMYNAPGRTQCDLLPDTVVQLSQLDNIAGIKDCSGKIERIAELRERCHPGFYIATGDDEDTLATIQHGGHGVISVAANVLPHAMAQLCQLASSSNVQARAQAVALDKILQPLFKALFIESNPMPVKSLLAALGKIKNNHMRLPMMPCETETLAKIQTVYSQVTAELATINSSTSTALI